MIRGFVDFSNAEDAFPAKSTKGSAPREVRNVPSAAPLYIGGRKKGLPTFAFSRHGRVPVSRERNF